MPPQGNLPSLEDLMKQYQYAVPTKHERHHPRPQDANWITRNIVSHLQSIGSGNLPSQTIPNLRGNVSIVTLRSEPQQEKFVPLPFPTRIPLARKPETNEELLKMFRKVEINIPLLDAIKQIPKYAKFLKELCKHKRKKMKGGVELGGIVLALTRNEEFTAGAQQALPKKCRDPRIFSIPCTIGDINECHGNINL
ncbi:hypothetical protein CR513_23461, partial [Mucuna pruriens]